MTDATESESKPTFPDIKFTPADIVASAETEPEEEQLGAEAPETDEEASNQETGPDTQETTSTAPEAPAEVKPLIDITEEDRIAFTRHVLGGVRFIKRYSIDKLDFNVTLQSRTVSENDELFDLIRQEVSAGRLAPSTTSASYYLFMYRLFLSASCVEYTFEGRSYPTQGATVPEKHEWLSKQLNEAQLKIFLRCQEDFEALMAALYREVASSDFTSSLVTAT